jgi:DNA transformation protein and related proteins
LADIQRLGSVATYARVKRSDSRITLNLLWALEGAVSGLPWQVVAKEHRTSLLLALDTLQHGASPCIERTSTGKPDAASKAKRRAS